MYVFVYVQVIVHTLTSVCSVLARCSLAVSDSFSTSMCCLQSEFWLVSVSSLVCRACISDSFLFSSCFCWSIWQSHTYRHTQVNNLVFKTFAHHWEKKYICIPFASQLKEFRSKTLLIQATHTHITISKTNLCRMRIPFNLTNFKIRLLKNTLFKVQ